MLLRVVTEEGNETLISRLVNGSSRVEGSVGGGKGTRPGLG